MTTGPRLPMLTIPLTTFSAEDPGGWTHMTSRARAADMAGIDQLVCSDHVCFGEHLEEYGKAETGGSKGGTQPTGPDGHWLDPLTTLSVVAGMTNRVRLRTHILLAALRRPVVLAKMAATLDVLSGGRLALGVGVGWQAEEYEAAGLPFEGRGRLLDHSLEVCETLWREQRADYKSAELEFSAIHQMPKPLQPGGVPFWIAGTIRSTTVRRLVRFGERWIPWGPEAANLLESIPRLKDAIDKAGGNADALQVVGHLALDETGGKPDISGSLDALHAQAAIGVTDFICNPTLPTDPEAAADVLRPLVSAFRSAVGRSDSE